MYREPIRNVEIIDVSSNNLSDIESECLIDSFEIFVKQMLKITFTKIEFNLSEYSNLEKEIQDFSLTLEVKRIKGKRHWFALFKNNNKELQIEGIVKYGIHEIHR